MRLRPHPPTQPSTEEEDLAVLDRWARGPVISVAAATRAEDREPSVDPMTLVKTICKKRHPAQESRLEEAIIIATQTQWVHRLDDAWPHGLADRLSHILDRVFAHQQREQAVVFPMLLKGVDALSARTVDEMIEAHEELLAEWRAVAELTGGFNPPAHACAQWRRLYAVCNQLQSDFLEQVGLENRMLLAGRVTPPPG